MWTQLVVMVMTAAPGRMALPVLDGAAAEASRDAATEALGVALTNRHYDVLLTRQRDAKLSPAQKDAFAACRPPGPRCYEPLAELLDVQSVLVGTISSVDGGLEALVNVLTFDGRLLATGRARVATEAQLADAMEAVAQALVVQFDAVAPRPDQLAPTGPPQLGVAFWAPVISGAVLIGAGLYMTVAGQVDLNAAVAAKAQGTVPADFIDPIITKDLVQRNVGIVGMSFGAASVLAGVIFGRPSPEDSKKKVPVYSLGGAVVPGGGVAVLRGSF